MYKSTTISAQLLALADRLGFEKICLWKASHSRIPAIYKVQQKIRRHFDAILNPAKHRLSKVQQKSPIDYQVYY